ncbi:type II toxin-antitoxin system RelE/ParE family toxin [Streptomyces daliensis]
MEEAIDLLARAGPVLGRPLADRVHGSRLHNLKELRPASSGSTEVRILFVFDPEREAILLVSGDKAGRWSRWYDEAIPLAEVRYEAYRARRRAESEEG